MTFVTIRMDEADKYDPYELACAVCKCFGLTLSKHRELKPVLNTRP
jgi:hypothetical protein